MLGPKRETVTGGWRKLHEEKLHSLYNSPNIIRKDEIGLAAYKMHGTEENCIQHFGLENLKGRENLEHLCIDRRIILEWILQDKFQK
jgi:hypothetical protein